MGPAETAARMDHGSPGPARDIWNAMRLITALALSSLFILGAGALMFPAPAKPGNSLAFRGNVTMTGIRLAALSQPAVFPALSLARFAREAQLSVRGLTKTTSELGPGRSFFELQARFPTDGNADSWSGNEGGTWVLPYDWPLATFPELTKSWDLKSPITVCFRTRCPDLAITVGEPLQRESSQTEESSSDSSDSSEENSGTVAPAKPGSTPSAEERWVEITYDPLPATVGAPTLALFCDKRLPAIPSSLLVACGATRSGTGNLGFSFQYSPLEGLIDSNGWHMSLDVGSGLRVAVASSLPDPLEAFGIDKTWGIDLQTRTGLLGTSPSLDVLKQATTPIGGDFFAGITSEGPTSGFFAGFTSQGPAGGVQFTSGQFGGSAVTVLSGGQVQLAGALTYRAGDLTLGYTWRPDGSGLIGRFTRDPLDLTLFLAGSDIQLGLSYTPERGPTVQASWSATKGFEIAVAAEFKLSLGGPVFEASEPSVELPLGRGNLVITPSSPWDGPAPPSADVKLPLPAPAQPAAPSTPASGATLIVRTCVVTEGKTACQPGDSALPLKASLDGTSVVSTGAEIPVSPGYHIVTVLSEAVPPRLVPVRGLRCDLTISARAVGICDLPFRQSGYPREDSPK